MALCISTVFQGVWSGDDATYAYIGVPVAFPVFSGSSGWGAVFVNSAPSGLSACDATSTHVVVSKSEWDVLRELQVIKDTLETEFAATRSTISLERQAVTSVVHGSTLNVQGSLSSRTQEVLSRSHEVEGSLFVAILVVLAIAGVFFGWKAAGRGAGRSG